MPDIFISYSRRNLDFVQKLDAALTAKGKAVWFDQKTEPLVGILPGAKWWEQIKDGVEAADNFFFVISLSSMASPYCNAEVAYALAHEKRLKILEWLKDPVRHFRPQVDGDLETDGVCVVLIAEKLGVSQPTATQHLKVLLDVELVKAKRIGKWTFISRNDQVIQGLCRVVDSL